MATHLDGRYPGSAGGDIYWQAWLPSGAPVAIVTIAHGLAEHSGRYAHVAERLARASYAVYALDHRGHGQSDGARANIGRMAHARDDLDSLISLARAAHPDRRCFLLGHSMGSVIVLDHLAAGHGGDLAGVVLSGAAVDRPSVGRVQECVARILSVIAPNVGVAPLDVDGVSRDPGEVAKYRADPLNYHGMVRARTGAELLAAIDRIARDLDTIRAPMLIMHGTEDRLASPEGSKLVADRVGSRDVTLTLYDGLYHEIFNEPERDQVLDDLIGWLDQHLANPDTGPSTARPAGWHRPGASETSHP